MHEFQKRTCVAQFDVTGVKGRLVKLNHIKITSMVGDQIDAQIFYTIRLFQTSTCFEQTRVHHQEVNCTNSASGIVTLCKWPSGMQGDNQRSIVLIQHLV